MAEHYTKNTEHGVLKHCNKCGTLTRHFCFSGRIGRCMEHKPQEETKKQKAARLKREREYQNPRLF